MKDLLIDMNKNMIYEKLADLQWIQIRIWSGHQRYKWYYITKAKYKFLRFFIVWILLRLFYEKWQILFIFIIDGYEMLTLVFPYDNEYEFAYTVFLIIYQYGNILFLL